jgi:hypothetical protein
MAAVGHDSSFSKVSLIGGGAATGALRTRKQPVAAPQGDRADGVLYRVSVAIPFGSGSVADCSVADCSVANCSGNSDFIHL